MSNNHHSSSASDESSSVPNMDATRHQRSLSEQEVFDDESAIVLSLAQANYETFYSLQPGTATISILEQSSAGISGWASCALSTSVQTKQDISGNKRQSSASSLSTSVPSQRRKCDDEENRALRLALLESVGVNVGFDAKQSLVHDADRVADSYRNDERESEQDWTVEEDDYSDLDGVSSLQSYSAGECGRVSQTDPFINSTNGQETDTSQDSESEFIIVSYQGKSETDSVVDEQARAWKTDLSPLTRDLHLDVPDGDDSEDSAESFVDVSAMEP